VRPRGHSMRGRVDAGSLVTLEPFGEYGPRVDEVVLVRCRGREYIHLIKAQQAERFLIGNDRGGLNGWGARNSILGRAVRIQRT
jgi:hypothetical protein